MSYYERKPITQEDIVQIDGKYLYVGNQKQKRFYFKGIAFPNPPTEKYEVSEDLLSGWNEVLYQLADETDINVVRLYEMDCTFDYNSFLETAAKLGIYVLVPFTQSTSDGVLSREKRPPSCYPQKLYEYGITCVQQYWDHPNVLAGVIGNEVMNDLVAWQSAPCVKSYLDDMTSFSKMYSVVRGENGDINNRGSQRLSFPLIYATQHDSPNAQLSPDEAIKLTLDYLSCSANTDYDETENNNFIFGINIESWCSSLQTFKYNEDGVTESSYFLLWKTLSGQGKTKVLMDAVSGQKTTVTLPPVSEIPVTTPVIFSEMGCSKAYFNRDNAVQPKYIRDWKQIPLVLNGGEMSDVISGFVAYAYDGGGSPLFRMMGSTQAWDGKHVLPQSLEYDNFRQQLYEAGIKDDVSDRKKKSFLTQRQPWFMNHGPRKVINKCHDATEKLSQVWDLHLYPLSEMPSYFSSNEQFQIQKRFQKVALAATTIEVDIVKSAHSIIMVFFGFLILIVLLIKKVLQLHKHRNYAHSYENTVIETVANPSTHLFLKQNQGYQSISR